MGHDDALRAGVKQARRMVMLFPGHAHDWRNSHRKSRVRDLGRGVDVKRAMLHVDEQPVEAARLADAGRILKTKRALYTPVPTVRAWRSPMPSASLPAASWCLV